MVDPTLPATPIHPGDPNNAANLTLIVDAIRAILQRTNLLETEGGQQAAALIGELETLATEDKSTVVAAINEVVGSIAEVDDRGGNLLTDGSFEAGTDGWTAGDGVALTQAATDPLDGTHALLVTCDGGRATGGDTPLDYATATRGLTGLIVGAKYEVALSARIDTGAPNVSCSVWDGSSLIGTVGVLEGVEAGWTRASLRFVATEQTVALLIHESTGDACSFAVDSAIVQSAVDYDTDLDTKAPLDAPEFVGPLTVVPAEGSPDEGLHRYSVRDEDTWDEFAADSDVTATADGGTRARGTLAAPEAVELGDILRYLWWREGHDGTGYSIASVAYLQVDDDVSEGIVPTALVVEQTDAAGVLQETLRIASDGTLTLPHASTHATGGSDALSPSDIGAAAASDLPYMAVVSGIVLPTATNATLSQAYLASCIYNAACINASNAVNNYFEWEVVVAAGTYTLRTAWSRNTGNGVATISVDGNALGSTIDMYGTFANNNITDHTGIALTAGRHKIRYTATSKNGSSTGYLIYVHGFSLTRTGA